MFRLFNILILAVSSVSAGTNVAVYRGIPVHRNIITLLCQGRGNFFIWRIDGNEVAIFNGRESVGHSIINTYNATTIEFNATLLSAATDSSSVPVRISSIDLNSDLFGNSVIRCETDLESSDIYPSDESGSTTTESIPDNSMTTESGFDTTTSTAAEGNCDNLELLQDLSSNSTGKCNDEEVFDFIMNLLDDILQYAKNNTDVMRRLQTTCSVTRTPELPSSIVSGALIQHISLRQIFFVVLLILGNY